MRIKRFSATDMRGALRQIRDEQGDDAVILSSRRTLVGVEVVAATDYDEALVSQFLGRDRTGKPVRRTTTPTPEMTAVAKPAAAPAAKRVAGIVEKPADKSAGATAKKASSANVVVNGAAARKPATTNLRSVATAAPADSGMDSIRRELSAMRQIIEGEMGRFAEERLRGVPVRAMALDELIACGCDRELARTLVTAIPPDAKRAQARGMMLGLLAKALVVPKTEVIDGGGVLALVGPSGVGKTTTIAKLAARYAAAHSTRDVALVTTDTGRAGGREQLTTFGRQLGMPVFDSRGGEYLARTLEQLVDYPLVLVDTAGLGPHDRALAAQFSWMASSRRVRSCLVLPANAQADDLDEVIRRFRCAAPEVVILSKVDETSRLGTSLSTVIRHRLPLAYVTDGQQVPEDIQRAEAHHLVIRMGELRRASTGTSHAETAHAIA